MLVKSGRCKVFIYQKKNITLKSIKSLFVHQFIWFAFVVSASNSRCMFRYDLTSFSLLTILMFVLERIISRGSKPTKPKKKGARSISERIQMNNFIGAKKKNRIIIFFSSFFWLRPHSTHRQLLYLITTTTNVEHEILLKCLYLKWWGLKQVFGTRKLFAFQINLFMVVFSHFIPFMWCTHPVKTKPTLHKTWYRNSHMKIITTSMQDMYRNDSTILRKYGEK